MGIHFHVSPILIVASIDTVASHFVPDSHVDWEEFFFVDLSDASIENFVVHRAGFFGETWSIWHTEVIMDEVLGVFQAFILGDLSIFINFIKDAVALVVFTDCVTTLTGPTSGEIGIIFMFEGGNGGDGGG